MILSPDPRSPESWLIIGTWAVGATFLWAGTLKALAPQVFSAHLTRLNGMPSRLNSVAAVVAAGLESGWGVALILRVAPALILPATAGLLAVLTSVAWWGVKSGRTTDCGCYAGYVVPSIGLSIALNTGLAALVTIAWIVLPHSSHTPTWKFLAAAITAVAIGGVAASSQSFAAKHGRLMIDMSPLKVGRRWRPMWGAAGPRNADELLVSYLGPDCPHCKQWVRVLNAMQHASGLPRVAGVVSTSSKQLQTFVDNSGIRFPVATIPQTLMSRLVSAVPTTVLVSRGTIQQQWSGHMPPEFFHRFRKAFFPAVDAETNRDGE